MTILFQKIINSVVQFVRIIIRILCNYIFDKIIRVLLNLNEKICLNRRIYLQIDEKKCRICIKNKINEIYELV